MHYQHLELLKKENRHQKRNNPHHNMCLLILFSHLCFRAAELLKKNLLSTSLKIESSFTISSSGETPNPRGRIPAQPALGDPALVGGGGVGGGGPDDLQMSLPTPKIL